MIEETEAVALDNFMVCITCGGVLRKISSQRELYKCKKCGESYDLDGMSNMEIDLPTFDRLLLYHLKNKRTKKTKPINTYTF
jgi:hypothetical protein